MVRLRPASEEAEQAAVAQWLDLRHVLYTHVPNGGYRHIKTAARLKQQGVKAGVPDLLIFDPPPKYKGAVGVALEMKRVGIKRASPAQQVWLKSMSDRGWLCAVQAGAAAAVAWLMELGY